jgi:membrane dipeptidase
VRARAAQPRRLGALLNRQDTDRSTVADAHLDLLLELAFRQHVAGQRDVFARTWLPLLQAGGVRLQVCPVFVSLERQPEGSLRDALGQVAAFHTALRENPHTVAPVRARVDLDPVERGERLGLVLALEGAEPFGYDLYTADVFWELGLRLVSLTWNRRNPFADGAAEGEDGGLSRLGRALVDRLRGLGVLLDLAHASPRTFAEVLDAVDDGRVLVSHAGCRAVNDHPRNLTDEQLRALAARDGVFCLMLHPLAIDPTRRTIARAIDHLEHAAGVVGVERVGLGGDFIARLSGALPAAPDPPDGLLPPGLELGSALEGLAGPEDYPALGAGLRSRGWSQPDTDAVMGGNLLALLRRSLPD